nr:MAG TPA: hypothetical protein [Caudoviricetes sp.]
MSVSFTLSLSSKYSTSANVYCFHCYLSISLILYLFSLPNFTLLWQAFPSDFMNSSAYRKYNFQEFDKKFPAP